VTAAVPQVPNRQRRCESSSRQRMRAKAARGAKSMEESAAAEECHDSQLAESAQVLLTEAARRQAVKPIAKCAAGHVAKRVKLTAVARMS
jgi:hypothetical protein